MPAKKRTASQTRWLQEHFSDPYVKQAHKLGLRSRASFKLEELQKKDLLIRQGNIVVDLGSSSTDDTWYQQCDRNDDDQLAEFNNKVGKFTHFFPPIN